MVLKVQVHFGPLDISPVDWAGAVSEISLYPYALCKIFDMFI